MDIIQGRYKQILAAVVAVILILGIVLGVYLVQRQTSLKSKASFSGVNILLQPVGQITNVVPNQQLTFNVFANPGAFHASAIDLHVGYDHNKLTVESVLLSTIGSPFVKHISPAQTLDDANLFMGVVGRGNFTGSGIIIAVLNVRTVVGFTGSTTLNLNGTVVQEVVASGQTPRNIVTDPLSIITISSSTSTPPTTPPTAPPTAPPTTPPTAPPTATLPWSDAEIADWIQRNLSGINQVTPPGVTRVYPGLLATLATRAGIVAAVQLYTRDTGGNVPPSLDALYTWAAAGSVTATPTATPTPTVNITASPNPIPVGATATTISWNTGSGASGQVYVSDNNAPEALFAANVSGTQDYTSAQIGHSYTFTLYEGTTHSTVLASVTVTR